jgi:hypothetical protein
MLDPPGGIDIVVGLSRSDASGIRERIVLSRNDLLGYRIYAI